MLNLESQKKLTMDGDIQNLILKMQGFKCLIRDF